MILVVEDDFDIRESLRELLEAEGYRVKTAENGEVALQILSNMRRRPCLLLLDLMMPVMDGWALMGALQDDDVYATIPVVVVSAAGDADAPRRAARFIKKPYNLEALLDCVESYCKTG